ncbi:hypothetical protein BaRGS_00014508 [Batillaria attramentaria]|uniref:Pre-mRNA-splicing factor SLU7 n=1 Tax=Batillaria attramentaria TaxID=370345 RepID=A0ABD0L4R6_9CAEN
MSFQLNMPPSAIGRLARSEQSVGDGDNKKQSREDWKKMKELEEARKAGTAPAMQDEEGKDINPHIPQYIMQAPWYFGANTPTLRHQRQQEEMLKHYSGLNTQMKKGFKEGPVATKYRKGACENCGAMTHKKKDCLERPRKIGAKFTGDMIAPDEVIPDELDYDFEGKRDIWNGFDPREHQRKLQEEYNKLEEAKQAMKEAAVEEDFLMKQAIVEKKDSEADDEDKYAEDMDMPGQKFETKQRITVRNLRIREDTAKYLLNLDLNSAYYDPKTRSMRENPLNGTNKEHLLFSGDAEEFAKKQLFAWEAYEKGTEAHLQADPTKLELLHREFQQRRENFKQTAKDSVLNRYGGQEHLEAPPKQLLLAQTEDYVEYSRHGTVIKGQEKARVKSRYEEDVYPSNHTSVWGSYWKDGQWGYNCCHSLIKESYCTGEAGIKAQQESSNMLMIAGNHHAAAKSDVQNQSDGDEALEAEEKHQKRMSKLMAMDERKRPYNSMYEVRAPTEEEMEAFRMKRALEEDPMAAFLSK